MQLRFCILAKSFCCISCNWHGALFYTVDISVCGWVFIPTLVVYSMQAISLLLLGPLLDRYMTGSWMFDYVWTTSSAVVLLLSCSIAVLVNFSQYACLGRFSALSFQVGLRVFYLVEYRTHIMRSRSRKAGRALEGFTYCMIQSKALNNITQSWSGCGKGF